MELSEFHRRYANVPLEKRDKILNVKESGLMSLSEVYREVQRLQDSIRPVQIEIEELIDLATPFLLKLDKEKGEK